MGIIVLLDTGSDDRCQQLQRSGKHCDELEDAPFAAVLDAGRLIIAFLL